MPIISAGPTSRPAGAGFGLLDAHLVRVVFEGGFASLVCGEDNFAIAADRFEKSLGGTSPVDSFGHGLIHV